MGGRVPKKMFLFLSCTIGIYDILAFGGFFDYVLKFHIPILTHRGINLAFLLFLGIVLQPARKKDKDRLPWYDVVLALMAAVPCLYVALSNERFLGIQAGDFDPTVLDKVLAFVLITAIFEATRRAAGWAMLGVALFFFSALFFGSHYPGFLSTRSVSVDYVVRALFCSVDTTSLFGQIADLASGILVAFMLFGGFLAVSGAGDFFIKLGLAVAGKYRGGPAKVAVVASGLMGMISGSGVANVATSGTMTIPLMKRVGYKPHFAGAVEAVASNGGQIMPPVMGLVAFFMAQLLNMPYWSICVAAALPAVLYMVSLFFMIDFEAGKEGLKGLEEEEVPPLAQTVKEGWYFSLPILIMVTLISIQVLSIERSCMITILSMIPISYLGGRQKGIDLRKAADSIQGGITSMAMIIGAVMGSGVIISAINITGIGLAFSRIVLSLAGDSILLLMVLSAASSFVLGMGMSSLPVYIIAALLVGPPLIEAGIPPVAAHLFFFWWAILSFITPPVAISAIAAAAIAGSDYWKTGWTACKIGIVAYILPFYFVYEPALIMRGEPLEIALVFARFVVGCWLLAGGIEGYLLIRAKPLERVLLVAAGLGMMLPNWRLHAAAMIPGAAVLLIQRMRARHQSVLAVCSTGT